MIIFNKFYILVCLLKDVYFFYSIKENQNLIQYLNSNIHYNKKGMKNTH
jgi:hypothetical protein